MKKVVKTKPLLCLKWMNPFQLTDYQNQEKRSH